MLPVCFPMVDGELFQSWLQSLAEAVGMPFPYFAKMYLGQKNSALCLEYANNLDEIVKRYCQVNSYFPGLYDIIGKHTYYAVTRLCMNSGMAAYVAETMLRNNDFAMRVNVVKKYKVCPVCEQEDMSLYGRRIIHVQHQIYGVRVCWKHSCALTGEMVQNMDVELAIAKFAADLFSNPPDCNFDDLAKYITSDSISGAVAAGYLSDKDGKRLLGCVQRAKDENAYMLIRYLAWQYSNGEGHLFQDVNPETALLQSDLFDRIYGAYGVGEYRCHHCGNLFHMSERTVIAGEVCPCCQSGMSEDERMTRILSRYGDGKYEIRNDELFHTVCGTGIKLKSMFWLNSISQCQTCRINQALDRWKKIFDGTDFTVLGLSETDKNDHYKRSVKFRHSCGCEFSQKFRLWTLQGQNVCVSCPVCGKDNKLTHRYNIATAIGRSKNAAVKRIGDRRIGKNGMGCEVVEYINYTNVLVRFDNGLEKRMKMEQFKLIGTGKYDVWSELYIGLEREMKDGRVGKIVKYINFQKLLVAFPDGENVWGSLRSFRRGTIGCYKQKDKAEG